MGKAPGHIDVAASLLPGTKDIVVPPSPAEEGKTAEIMSIDQANADNNIRQRRSGQSTGPRTELGKQRSSQNATRHGIFSKAVLLKGESQADFESLRLARIRSVRPNPLAARAPSEDAAWTATAPSDQCWTIQIKAVNAGPA